MNEQLAKGDILVRTEEMCGATNWVTGTIAVVVNVDSEAFEAHVEKAAPSPLPRNVVNCFRGRGYRHATKEEIDAYHARQLPKTGPIPREAMEGLLAHAEERVAELNAKARDATTVNEALAAEARRNELASFASAVRLLLEGLGQ